MLCCFAVKMLLQYFLQARIVITRISPSLAARVHARFVSKYHLAILARLKMACFSKRHKTEILSEITL